MLTAVMEFFFIFYFYLRSVMKGFFVFFWQQGYNWGNKEFSKMQSRIPFLNYGYKEGAVKENADVDRRILAKKDAMKAKLPAHFQQVWCSTQLYASVLAGYPEKDGGLDGKAILEVGCGRGGGASVIHAFANPASYLGIDLSESAIENCREVHRNEKGQREFRVGNSMALEQVTQKAAYDAVVNVESAHCYPDFRRFMEGVKHALKPNGYFLYTDLGCKSEFEDIRNIFRQLGFRIVEENDVTRNVTHSLRDEIAPFLQQTIRKAGSWWQKPWLALVETQMVNAPRNCLEDGSAQYRRFICQKA